ncbi:hypothetical protein [Streptomyces sp. NBC_00286]|uniref:hypothetical protein n=1 Tax=Streptomyces sp. NBC_00286 TaxID=2975701 RepID=UPI002E2D508B|nr:hypothetical protein [Streptomyces sp. NBC_00286]
MAVILKGNHRPRDRISVVPTAELVSEARDGGASQRAGFWIEHRGQNLTYMTSTVVS